MKLVAENSPEQIAQQRAEAEAAHAIRRLVGNLLRVLAGAGEPVSVFSDLHDATLAYAEYIKLTQDNMDPGIPGLADIDVLFDSEDPKPRTEDEWRKWAMTNPERDWNVAQQHIIKNLHRSVLRHLAAKMTNGPPAPRVPQRD